jgi:hypothetical protein
VSAVDRIIKALQSKTPMTPAQEKAVRVELQKYVDELLERFSGKIVAG